MRLCSINRRKQARGYTSYIIELSVSCRPRLHDSTILLYPLFTSLIWFDGWRMGKVI